MLPRFSASTHQSVSHGVLARQARVAATAHRSNYSRQQVVALANRLVLTPTGNGKWDHIGDQVPLPEPIPLTDGVYEVGRNEPADIVLNIPTVSGRHALLRVEDDKISITDLNSTNGTVVDGRELTPMDDAQLTVGSEVIFGDMYLAKFIVTQAGDELPSEGSGAGGLSAAGSGTMAVDAAQTSAPLQQQQEQQQQAQAAAGEVQLNWHQLQLGW